MKKVMSILLAVIMVFSVFAIVPFTASAAETNSEVAGESNTRGDFEYTILDDGTAEITYYTGEATELIIPSKIDGYDIINISSWAFSNCTSLKSITISNGVKEIGYSAFENCKSLTSIVIPDSIICIEENAFFGCENITDVYYDGSIDSWENIEIGEGNNNLLYNVSIHYYYFQENYPEWCDYINCQIDENGTLTISGSGAINPDGYSLEDEIPWYSERESIKNVVIEEGITEIGNYSFMGCRNLKNVSIPASVTYVGDFAFFDVASVERIDVSENNANYTSSDGVLFDKEQTEIIKYPNGKSGSYSIPSTVDTVNINAFRECINLTGVEIPDSITTIEWGAFYDCTSLLSVTVPSSVTDINIGCGLGYIFHKSMDEPIDGFTIKGYTCTAAETYANENGFKFIALDGKEIGDVNGDGILSVSDATLIQKYAASLDELTPEQLETADFNGDGAVNVNDATAIQKEIVSQ